MKVLITGASSGIGRQLALDYHRDGHQIWALGRNPAALAELEVLGIRTQALELTDRAAVLAWCQGLGSLDLAILNAGTCEYLELPAFDSAAFIRVMEANLATLAICIEGVLPALQRGNNPRLAAMSSSAAFAPLPRAEAYGASKAAIRYLMDCLEVSLQGQGIGVSTLFPGFVKTPLTDKNDFPMPLRISAETASLRIRQGLAKGRRHIHFPKTFTWPLRLLGALPQGLWRHLAKGMLRR
ncbi:SDR family NAD(P)-dependent oxidoreductase [Gallaecimonas kandeliae]|uniref:SDR family NAD(P)-dependent oxidoreductase n=1 Tax=Gallaecimonas kandeliae TaxID=3029055 RepID=UPI00264A3087|nr:SDR family NAD(P)-dependent oxidoreductase [Gallaecimonas kandeliae]WKE63943.1 SDR family NAD(P)-dependent oxidoreductase [Gallaecimonas kandeliae]